jgi:hypothetical protein
MPFKIHQPSLSSVLGVLNNLKGIIIISMGPSPAEIAEQMALPRFLLLNKARL